jgi:hypothetical protein
MKCTKQEALLIFRRWYERGIPLLLDLQIASTEPVFIKGTITHLNSADLLFSGSALSVTVNFGQMDFEYEELAIGGELNSLLYANISSPIGIATNVK